MDKMEGDVKMETETHLARMIETTDRDARYDRQVKKLLSNEAILAWVLKTCTEEFSALEPGQIISCIEGEPEVSLKALHPIDRDEDRAEEMLKSDRSITGSNTEDASLKEQTVYYDIRLNAKAPGSGRPIELIINIEAQHDSSPGYPVEKRAIYYCCRLVSSQYGTVFSHSEYKKIRKVYSIWFCTNPAEKRRNTIKRISLKEEPVYGTSDTRRQDVDLMQAVIVNLGDPESGMDNKILRLMDVLLSPELDTREKKRVMQDEFHIAMTVDLESEVSEMCNLSLGVLEKGLEKGIVGCVEILRENGMDDAKIVESIKKKYQLTQEKAEEYVFAAVKA